VNQGAPVTGRAMIESVTQTNLGGGRSCSTRLLSAFAFCVYQGQDHEDRRDAVSRKCQQTRMHINECRLVVHSLLIPSRRDRARRGRVSNTIQDSSLGTDGLWTERPGYASRLRQDITCIPQRLDPLWRQPSLLSIGYRGLFPGGKTTGE
jgi:hypothetical protein